MIRDRWTIAALVDAHVILDAYADAEARADKAARERAARARSERGRS